MRFIKTHSPVKFCFISAIILTGTLFTQSCSDDEYEEPRWRPVDNKLGTNEQNNPTTRTIESEPTPQKGQDHRSSGNFSTKGMNNTGSILWNCPEGVTFSVWIDKTGKDGVMADNLYNGAITPYYESDKLYIANPHGTDDNFIVTYSSFEPEEGCVYVTSSASPLSGQNNRSSQNFGLGNYYAYYVVSCDKGISFNLMKDVSGGNDYVVLENITDGDIIGNHTDLGGDLYISNPSDAGSSFLVSFQPYVGTLDWMDYISDSTPVSQISIPGTHDTGTFGLGAGDAKCQNYNYDHQLTSGLRAFDIRLNEKLEVIHGSNLFKCGTNLTDVLNSFNNFLEDHPSEVIFMSVKEDDGHIYDSFMNFYNSNKDLVSRIYTDIKCPTLGQVRGKIILIRRFKVPEGTKFGWNCYNNWPNNATGTFAGDDGMMTFHVEDNYNEFNISDKGYYVYQNLNKAADNKSSRDFYITFNSIATDVFKTPWMFAWGGGLFDTEGEMFELHCNLTYLSAFKRPTGFGIILMDFPNRHCVDDPCYIIQDIINANYTKNRVRYPEYSCHNF